MSGAYPIAFLVGVLGSMHCAGMCGGILGALSYSLPAATRAHPARLLRVLLALNLGRIGSYAAAGALVGGAGGALVEGGAALSGAAWIGVALRGLAALVVVGIGLYLGGWFPGMAAVERLGAPLWSRLAPLANRLIPIRGPGQAALYGVLWGWLPCGLVYSMLISTPAQAGALSGALYLALFGAGTLPVTLGGGLLAGRLYALARDRRYRSAAGLGVIALGLSMLLVQGYNEWS